MENQVEANRYLKFGDQIMLFHNDPSYKWEATDDNSDAVFKKSMFLGSHGFVDESLRIQILHTSSDAQTLKFEELITDSCFKDKVFFFVPKLSSSDLEDLKVHMQERENTHRVA